MQQPAHPQFRLHPLDLTRAIIRLRTSGDTVSAMANFPLQEYYPITGISKIGKYLLIASVRGFRLAE